MGSLTHCSTQQMTPGRGVDLFTVPPTSPPELGSLSGPLHNSYHGRGQSASCLAVDGSAGGSSPLLQIGFMFGADGAQLRIRCFIPRAGGYWLAPLISSNGRERRVRPRTRC